MIFFNEFTVLSGLCNLTLIEDEDDVGVLYCRQSVGDSDGGSIGSNPFERTLDQCLGLSVNACCRLVKYDDVWVLKDPSKRYALLLSSRQSNPVVAQ